MVRTILLAFLWLPLSPAFAYQAAPAPVHQRDTIDRVLGMVGPAEPTQLTEKKRFELYLVSTVGPVPLLGEALGAGISHWQNTPEEWGQGWGAYGKRYGSAVAYNGVRQTITYAASIAFHEDNRYFASHKSGFWPRTRYALLSTVTSRSPDGRRTFSVSSVSGVVGAAAISSVWGPPSWRNVGSISGNAGISFGVTAGFNIVREFLPDILHRTP